MRGGLAAAPKPLTEQPTTAMILTLVVALLLLAVPPLVTADDTVVPAAAHGSGFDKDVVGAAGSSRPSGATTKGALGGADGPFNGAPLDNTLLFLDVRGYMQLPTDRNTQAVKEEFKKRLMRSLSQRLDEVFSSDMKSQLDPKPDSVKAEYGATSKLAANDRSRGESMDHWQQQQRSPSTQESSNKGSIWHFLTGKKSSSEASTEPFAHRGMDRAQDARRDSGAEKGPAAPLLGSTTASKHVEPFRVQSATFQSQTTEGNRHHAAPAPAALVISLARQQGPWRGSEGRFASAAPGTWYPQDSDAAQSRRASSLVVTETSLPFPALQASQWIKAVGNAFEQKAYANIRFPGGESFLVSSKVELDNPWDQWTHVNDSSVWSEFRAISSAESSGLLNTGETEPSKLRISEGHQDKLARSEGEAQVVLGRRLLEQVQRKTGPDSNTWAAYTDYKRPVGFNFGNGGGVTFPDGTTINFGGGGGVHVGYAGAYQTEFGSARSQSMAKVERLFVAALARSLDWEAMRTRGLDKAESFAPDGTECCTPVAFIDQEEELCIASCVSCRLAGCCIKPTQGSNISSDEATFQQQRQPELIWSNKLSSSSPSGVCAKRGYASLLKSAVVSFRPVASLNVQIFGKSDRNNDDADCSKGWPTKQAVRNWRKALTHANSVKQFVDIWLTILNEIQKCFAGDSQGNEIGGVDRGVIEQPSESLVEYEGSPRSSPHMKNSASDCVTQHFEVARQRGDNRLAFCVQACVSPKVAQLNILKNGPCPKPEFKLWATLPAASRFWQPTRSSDTSVWVRGAASHRFDDSGSWLMESASASSSDSWGWGTDGSGRWGTNPAADADRDDENPSQIRCFSGYSDHSAAAALLSQAGAVLQTKIDIELLRGGVLELLTSKQLGATQPSQQHPFEGFSTTRLWMPVPQVCEDISEILRHLGRCCSNDSVHVETTDAEETNNGSTRRQTTFNKPTRFECIEFETSIEGECRCGLNAAGAAVSAMLGLQEGTCRESGYSGPVTLIFRAGAGVDNPHPETADVAAPTCRVVASSLLKGNPWSNKPNEEVALTALAEARLTTLKMKLVLPMLQSIPDQWQLSSRVERYASALLREYGHRLLNMLNIRSNELIPEALVQRLLSQVHLRGCGVDPRPHGDHDVENMTIWPGFSAWRMGNTDRGIAGSTEGVQCRFAITRVRFVQHVPHPNVPELGQEPRALELTFPTIMEPFYRPVLDYLAGEGIITRLNSGSNCS